MNQDQIPSTIIVMAAQRLSQIGDRFETDRPGPQKRQQEWQRYGPYPIRKQMRQNLIDSLPADTELDRDAIGTRAPLERAQAGMHQAFHVTVKGGVTRRHVGEQIETSATPISIVVIVFTNVQPGERERVLQADAEPQAI